MSTLTIRLPDDTHNRLKSLAKSRRVSINKLFEEFSAIALAEHDAHMRFTLRAARGNTAQGFAILDKLDAHFE
jgi:predicted transcriptional regulator